MIIINIILKMIRNQTLKFKNSSFNSEWKNNKIKENEKFTFNNREKYVDSKKLEEVYIIMKIEEDKGFYYKRNGHIKYDYILF